MTRRHSLGGHFQRAQDGDAASRAAMFSAYASASAVRVDPRNSDVRVVLAAHDSSSCSSDSESGSSFEPSSEPSPPKSVPKPWGYASVTSADARSRASREDASSFRAKEASASRVFGKNVRWDLPDDKPTPATRTSSSSRHGFSPSASSVSFASSMCSTQGTISLHSSTSSVRVASGTHDIMDDGKLSVAELTSSSPSPNQNAASNELPPRLQFILRSVPESPTPGGSDRSASGNATVSASTASRLAATAPSTFSLFPSQEELSASAINQSSSSSTTAAHASSYSSAPFTVDTTPPTSTGTSTISTISTDLNQSATSIGRDERNDGETLACSRSACGVPVMRVRHQSTQTEHADASGPCATARNRNAVRSQNTTASPCSTNNEEVKELLTKLNEMIASKQQVTEPQPPQTSSGFSFGQSDNSSSSTGTTPAASTAANAAATSTTNSDRELPTMLGFGVYTSLDSIMLDMSEKSQIARGRSGTIYQATSGFSRFAVKVTTKPVGKSAIIRFEQDIKKLQKLPEHPGLVRHHGCMGMTDLDTIGVITDMVAGSETVHARLYNSIRLMNEKDKHLVLLQILDAIAFLHSHDVTHRDLSLKHVLHSYGLSSETIKLVDFGLPSLRAAAKSVNNTGCMSDWMGVTPEYASPEVLRGDISSRDEEAWKKCDMFSFAVLMAELLTEEIPWDDQLPMFIVNAVAKRGERGIDLDNLRLFGRKSPELEAVIESAWHDEPEFRPTAKILRAKLEGLFAQIGADNTCTRGNTTASTSSMRFSFSSQTQPSRSPSSSSSPPPSGSVGSTNFASTAPPMSSVFGDSVFSSQPSLSSLQLIISDKTLIAKGRRGPIYRAKIQLKEIAAKIVSKPTSRSASSKLEKELSAVKALPVHPNLVRHYGSVSIDGGNSRAVITDLFGGQSLDYRVHQCTTFRLDEPDRHRVLLQIIDAIAFLHAHGITHRDLALKHVLITYGSPPTVKLVDFGLPTLRICDRGDTHASAALGCALPYVSPEILRGHRSNKEEDECWEQCNGGWASTSASAQEKPSWRQCDVYSFAVLLMEVLMEERPWDGEQQMFIINAVAKHEKRPFNVEDVRVFGKKSPQLESLVREAWHDDPMKRPSALEVKTRLERIFKPN